MNWDADARGGATLMDGRALALAILADLTRQVSALTVASGAPPALAIVQIGQDRAAASYVRAIVRTCEGVGVTPCASPLPAGISPSQFGAELDSLADDPDISGIIVQMPVPAVLLSTLRAHMPPAKDVDGIHPLNAGLLTLGDPDAFVPATPLGAMALLSHYGVELEGRRAVVVGRSAAVGRPMALLLLQANATVTICHTRTQNLAEVTRTAEVLVIAAGRPRLITAEMVSQSATVIDFGVNFVGGQMVGDVDTEPVSRVAARITPVPGGTGPMTNLMLLQNTARAAWRQRERA
jgi:methylenetetrahydrofolate dehydrogenase (NADP+)/methenyltetrahydrofolate cyclohydrolase